VVGNTRKLSKDAIPTIFAPKAMIKNAKIQKNARMAVMEHDYAAKCSNANFLNSNVSSIDNDSEVEEEIFMDCDDGTEPVEVEVSDSDRVVHEQQVQIKELQDQLEASKVKNEHMNAKMVELEKNQAAPEDLLSNFFSNDELDFLKRRTMKGKSWTSITLKKALKLRFSCGKTGYENLLSMGYPLPAIRTLQKRTEHLEFESGILSEVFEALSYKAAAMTDQEKLCCLTMDEMSIRSSLDYDVKSDSFLGDSTIPGHNGMAKKALVFQLGHSDSTGCHNIITASAQVMRVRNATWMRAILRQVDPETLNF
jgi:hypothetical protein